MQNDLVHKMEKLKALSEAIDRAKEANDLKGQGTTEKALAIQRLTRDRAALKATLPPLTVIEGGLSISIKGSQG